MSILNPAKRDGGIMNCFLDPEVNNGVVMGASKILDSCLEVLQRLSQAGDPPPNPDEFPSLPQVTHEEVEAMQKRMSRNKAVALDSFSDVWFKQQLDLQLICDWWNPETIKILAQKTFETRLIPLNKEYPNLPQPEQFRPIVIVSHAIKWLESRFRSPIQNYVNSSIDKNQIGFVSGCATSMNTY